MGLGVMGAGAASCVVVSEGSGISGFAQHPALPLPNPLRFELK